MGNIYKSFRDLYEVQTTNSLQKRYDEPTYLSFRVLFIPSFEFNDLQLTNYDRMPHPLFEGKVSDNYDERTAYSTINFLRDSNEFTRATLLEEFISKMNDLQYDYQWYFQGIEGIGELLTVNTTRGKRVPEDFRLTIRTLEGLDLRVSYLLNLYKKIAWDDTYQRWILPDMMRFFRMRIYITEYRTFHIASNQFTDNVIIPTYESNKSQSFIQSIGATVAQPVKDFVSTLRPSQAKLVKNEFVILNALENVMPTWVLELEQCEFDIEHMPFTYLSDMSNADDPNMAEIEFKIKVGKVHELQSYPVFRYGYLSDKVLNLLPNRTKEKDERLDSNEASQSLNNITVPYNGASFDSNRELINIIRLNEALNYSSGSPESHVSGTPFNQGGGAENIKNSGPSADIEESINPTEPNTWAGNAIKFGEAYVGNYVEDTVEKLTMTPFPGLGFSLNEATTALESKDFTQVFALVRKAIAEAQSGELAPGQSLNNEIVDTAFKDFLVGITQSDATDDDTSLLISAAKDALGDANAFEKIKDLSLATDLTATDIGEINTSNPIQTANDYKQFVREQSDNDRSKATDLDGGPRKIETITIFESVPSSSATDRKINQT